MKVAVLDDDEVALSRGCDQVKALENEPYRLLIRGHRPLRDVLEEIEAERCQAVISDHRFQTRAQVDFSGAELVYRANERGLPAVLYSAHVDEDEADSIREWRYGIPRVVRKAPGALRHLKDALQVAESEAHGVRELSRQGFLTPVRVVSVSGEWGGAAGTGAPTVDVTVTAWKPRERLQMPLALLPVADRDLSQSLVGRIYLGEVNYYAQDSHALFFHNLRLAPRRTPSPQIDRRSA
ncbi:hypothetical protein ACFVH7_05175 [Kitasatospora indigofera]|uniref:hypothetical protein n=1 Tax=Kitasatospora indigofera TaxID=67307 RepID=UPI003637B9B6